MHFQVRTDSHIENSEELIGSIRDEIEAALLPRFEGRLRRVEVYLQDMNGHKRGGDTRCSMEVSLAGHQAVAADDKAPGVDQAVSGALNKLLRALERALGTIEDRGGRVSMSGEE